MTRLWDRGEPLDSQILAYTAGEDHVLDARLVSYDCRASAAHARMLASQGYLTAADAEALCCALDDIASAFGRGEWQIALADEDCHTAIENRLVAKCGEAGRRIHLGRSRNDQVLVALRLWLKDALSDLAVDAEGVAEALDHLAKTQGHLPMPGYTHLQRAMPSSVAMWAGGFASEIRDDAAGLRAATRRADRNPLGSAAGYGAPVVTLDRAHTTQALGFAEVHDPVTAVQVSRGKAEATALFEATMLAQDLGKLSADLCLFTTYEFRFVQLPDAFTTGSSMLPQKRNPDVFEIARGRTSEALAALNEVIGITAKMPSGYHRDWQLLKPPLFRGLDCVAATTRIIAHAIPGLVFDAERLKAAMDPSLHAAEHANRLVVEQGIPFREAYQRVREQGLA